MKFVRTVMAMSLVAALALGAAGCSKKEEATDGAAAGAPENGARKNIGKGIGEALDQAQTEQK